jgi:hypothetical protein
MFFERSDLISGSCLGFERSELGDSNSSEVTQMTVIDKGRAFWMLQEAFDYIRGSAAVNWDALRLILEAQRQVFASYAPRTPLHFATASEEFLPQAKRRP